MFKKVIIVKIIHYAYISGIISKFTVTVYTQPHKEYMNTVNKNTVAIYSAFINKLIHQASTQKKKQNKKLN